MAKILRRVERHNCREELPGVDSHDLWYGSVVECSCGIQFMKLGDQREGDYWNQLEVAQYITEDEK